MSNRRLQRIGLGLLRRSMPILRWGKTVVVTQYSAVTDVLDRPRDFSVVPIYAEKMQRTSGDFFLGMDDVPQYHQERKLTNTALAGMDLDWYEKLTRQFVREELEQPVKEGRIDLVQQLSWVVPLRLCEEFFGVTGPDRRALARWVRYIFQHLFLNLDDDATVAARAERLSAEMERRLNQLLSECRQDLEHGKGERRDFLSQLVRVQLASDPPLSDEVIRRNLAGVFLGSVDTVSRAVVNAIDELLERPFELAAAQQAAQAGNRDVVASHVFEALRFNPHNPLVVRHALAATSLRTDGGKEVSIPAGSRVFAMTYAAMFDPKQYPDPTSFRTGRSGLSHLQFGYGFHRCFGERLALIAVTEILTGLLQLRNLARARGPAGRLVLDGPFPDHFQLSFDRGTELLPH